jgi:hypothetical protein
MPHSVIVIRHAEKPTDDTDPNLAVAGYARALKLADYFTHNPVPAPNSTPTKLFASSPTKHSRRPELTALPTAARLCLAINTDYADDDAEELAHHLLTHPKLRNEDVLIVWHHGEIPRLLRALGVPAKEAPQEIDETDYSGVWIVRFPGPTLETHRQPF